MSVPLFLNSGRVLWWRIDRALTGHRLHSKGRTAKGSLLHDLSAGKSSNERFS